MALPYIEFSTDENISASDMQEKYGRTFGKNVQKKNRNIEWDDRRNRD